MDRAALRRARSGTGRIGAAGGGLALVQLGLPRGRRRGGLAALDPGPVILPANWLEWVNEPQTEAELEAVRRSVARGCPYGADSWVQAVVQRLGLQSTIRPRGRPRQPREEIVARPKPRGRPRKQPVGPLRDPQ